MQHIFLLQKSHPCVFSFYPHLLPISSLVLQSSPDSKASWRREPNTFPLVRISLGPGLFLWRRGCVGSWLLFKVADLPPREGGGGRVGGSGHPPRWGTPQSLWLKGGKINFDSFFLVKSLTPFLLKKVDFYISSPPPPHLEGGYPRPRLGGSGGTSPPHQVLKKRSTMGSSCSLFFLALPSLTYIYEWGGRGGVGLTGFLASSFVGLWDCSIVEFSGV